MKTFTTTAFTAIALAFICPHAASAQALKKSGEYEISSGAINARMVAGGSESTVPVIAYLQTEGHWNICLTEDLGRTFEVIPGSWPGISLQLAGNSSGHLFMVIDKEIVDEESGMEFRSINLYHRSPDQSWQEVQRVNSPDYALPAGQSDLPQVIANEETATIVWYQPWAVGFFSRNYQLETREFDDILKGPMPHGHALTGMRLAQGGGGDLHLFSPGALQQVGPIRFTKLNEWEPPTFAAPPGDEFTLSGKHYPMATTASGEEIQLAVIEEGRGIHLYQSVLSNSPKGFFFPATETATSLAIAASSDQEVTYLFYTQDGAVMCQQVSEKNSLQPRPDRLLKLQKGEHPVALEALHHRDKFYLLVTHPNRSLKLHVLTP